MFIYGLGKEKAKTADGAAASTKGPADGMNGTDYEAGSQDYANAADYGMPKLPSQKGKVASTTNGKGKHAENKTQTATDANQQNNNSTIHQNSTLKDSSAMTNVTNTSNTGSNSTANLNATATNSSTTNKVLIGDANNSSTINGTLTSLNGTESSHNGTGTSLNGTSSNQNVTGSNTTNGTGSNVTATETSINGTGSTLNGTGNGQNVTGNSNLANKSLASVTNDSKAGEAKTNSTVQKDAAKSASAGKQVAVGAGKISTDYSSALGGGDPEVKLRKKLVFLLPCLTKQNTESFFQFL
jgi:hypothetical protein